MNNLFPILGLIFTFSLLLNYLTFNYKMSSFEIVNDMGIGYNLGSLFDCYDYSTSSEDIRTPDDQITLFGNKPPTKETIYRIKKYGFKTIRFPITWSYFIDEFNNINSEWMKRVKEVVNWIIDNNMYCIINMYKDGDYNNWLNEGIEALDKFKKIWEQISKEFIDYDNHLIFESLDRPEIFIQRDDFITLFNFTQAFVDTIRNSGGNNKDRLLIISGATNELDLSYNLEYIIPKDPYDKLAFSIYYFQPFDFSKSIDYDYSYTDPNGYVHQFSSIKKWGSDFDYNQMVNKFELIKTNFINKGFPVIIAETGVLTQEKKEKNSIQEYLYAVFSMASSYNGIMACLWDTSQANFGEMKFYNREMDKWYDVKIRDNFKKISRGRFVNPTNFYIMSNKLTVNIPNSYGYIDVKFDSKKAIKLSFNVKINGHFNDIYYILVSYDSKEEFKINIGENNLKKEYDGTLTFTVYFDAYKKNFTQYIEIQKLNYDNITTFNNLIVEFEENFLSLDINAYKNAISNYD